MDEDSDGNSYIFIKSQSDDSSKCPTHSTSSADVQCLESFEKITTVTSNPRYLFGNSHNESSMPVSWFDCDRVKSMGDESCDFHSAQSSFEWSHEIPCRSIPMHGVVAGQENIVRAYLNDDLDLEKSLFEKFNKELNGRYKSLKSIKSEILLQEIYGKENAPHTSKSSPYIAVDGPKPSSKPKTIPKLKPGWYAKREWPCMTKLRTFALPKKSEKPEAKESTSDINLNMFRDSCDTLLHFNFNTMFCFERTVRFKTPEDEKETSSEESVEVKKESKSKRCRRRFRKVFKLQRFHKKVKHNKVRSQYIEV